MIPLLTVITVTYNCEHKIKDTFSTIKDLKSVFGDDLEFIVVDGVSKDFTLKEINFFGALVDKLISEKDAGIYDAMNKGLFFAKGKWVNFMNTGDAFNKKHLNVLYTLLSSSSEDVLYGDVLIGLSSENSILKKAGTNISARFPMPFCHQSSFVKRENFYKNDFELEYKRIADKAFFLSLLMANKKFKYFRYSFAKVEFAGFSNVDMVETVKEENKLLLRHGVISILMARKRVVVMRLLSFVKRITPKYLLTLKRKIYI